MRTVVPSTSTFSAKVSWGTPRRSDEHRRDDGHPGVGALGAEDHEVPLDRAERLGEDRRGGERVRPVDGVVHHVDAGVGAHGQRLADRLRRLLRTHGEDRDLAGVLLGELQGLLDGVLVELVHHRVGRVTVEGLVGGAELLLGPRVGDLLDADDDLHGRGATLLAWRSGGPALGGDGARQGTKARNRGRPPASSRPMLLVGSIRGQPPARCAARSAFECHCMTKYATVTAEVAGPLRMMVRVSASTLRRTRST